jgi:translation initiation factor eIF-2B subunit epsilon
VVLADSYNRRFEVLCLDQPRILLPLCGIPLLAYTLESLSHSKVKQVFIFCGVHADKIREFVACVESWRKALTTASRRSTGCLTFSA